MKNLGTKPADCSKKLKAGIEMLITSAYGIHFVCLVYFVVTPNS
jgi:hypothetical protein